MKESLSLADYIFTIALETYPEFPTQPRISRTKNCCVEDFQGKAFDEIDLTVSVSKSGGTGSADLDYALCQPESLTLQQTSSTPAPGPH